MSFAKLLYASVRAFVSPLPFLLPPLRPEFAFFRPSEYSYAVEMGLLGFLLIIINCSLHSFADTHDRTENPIRRSRLLEPWKADDTAKAIGFDVTRKDAPHRRTDLEKAARITGVKNDTLQGRTFNTLWGDLNDRYAV